MDTIASNFTKHHIRKNEEEIDNAVTYLSIYSLKAVMSMAF